MKQAYSNNFQMNAMIRAQKAAHDERWAKVRYYAIMTVCIAAMSCLIAAAVTKDMGASNTTQKETQK
jgi:uncharacterized membrane protein